MMKLENIVECIEKIAPLQLGEEWDNSGIQIDVGNDSVSRIMCCLEINEAVIREAVNREIDLIITHHPLIFYKQKDIDINKITGNYIINLIKAGISVYSAHITFDNAPLGNNYYLAKLLKLESIKKPAFNTDNHPGLIGELPEEITFERAVSYVEEVLDLPPNYVRGGGVKGVLINRVAICTGAGGDFLKQACKEGAQLLITGDVKLHQAMEARALGMAFIDAGHYGTEKIFAENMADLLRELIPDEIEILEASSEINPYTVW